VVAVGEYCYNTSFQTALKASPFQVVYGRVPLALISYEPGLAKLPAVDRQLMDRDAFLVNIKDWLLHTQDLMRAQHDRHHRHVEFQVSQWVWLRLHQRLAASIIDKSAGKLAPRFYGPYRVLERIGPVAYRLELPPRSRIHSIFHVVFLKKYEGAPPAEIVQLPAINHVRVLPAPTKAIHARMNRGN